MKLYVPLTAVALIALTPLIAESPKGWKVRADRSTSATDPDAAGAISFTTMGKGFHAVNPQSAAQSRAGRLPLVERIASWCCSSV